MRRMKLQQADCIADSKTMLLFLCEGALFCSSLLISTISQTLKNICCFSIFLFPFYILINSFIVYFHNPGMFHSSNIQQSGFSANHFHLCMETEPNKEPKSIFLHLRYAPQPYSSKFVFPESLFHFCIQANTSFPDGLFCPWSQCTQQPQALSSSQQT